MSVVSGQLSVVSCQWAVVSGQLSVVSCQWAVGSGQWVVGSGLSDLCVGEDLKVPRSGGGGPNATSCHQMQARRLQPQPGCHHWLSSNIMVPIWNKNVGISGMYGIE